MTPVSIWEKKTVRCHRNEADQQIQTNLNVNNLDVTTHLRTRSYNTCIHTYYIVGGPRARQCRGWWTEGASWWNVIFIYSLILRSSRSLLLFEAGIRRRWPNIKSTLVDLLTQYSASNKRKLRDKLYSWTHSVTTCIWSLYGMFYLKW